MNNKVLVTGGLGYIGSHVIIEMIKNGFEPFIIDNLSNSSIKTLDQIKMVTFKEVPFFNIDIRETEKLKKIIYDNELKKFIHLAAKKSVEESFLKEEVYYDNNIKGLISLLNILQDIDNTTLIFSSSACVYNLANSAPFKESDELLPSSPYGKSKLECEKLLNKFYNLSANTSISVLRYFNPVGVHSSGKISLYNKSEFNNIFNMIDKVLKKELPELPIFGNDYNTIDGTCVRDYFDIADLAKVHIKLLDLLRHEKDFLIVNLGSGKGTSILQLLETFSKINNVKIPFKFEKRRKGDLGVIYSDTSLAMKILNWRPTSNLEEICYSAYSQKIS